MTKRAPQMETVAELPAVEDAPENEAVIETVAAIQPPPILESARIAAECTALEQELAELVQDQAVTTGHIAERWHGDSSDLASEYSQREARLVGGRARLGLLKRQRDEAEKTEVLARYEAAIQSQAEMYAQIAQYEDEQAALYEQIQVTNQKISDINGQLQVTRGRASNASAQARKLGVNQSELGAIYQRYSGLSRHM